MKNNMGLNGIKEFQLYSTNTHLLIYNSSITVSY